MKRTFHILLATVALLSSCLCAVVHAVDADLHFHAGDSEDSVPCHTPCEQDTVPCEHPEPTYRTISDDSVNVTPLANGVVALAPWSGSHVRDSAPIASPSGWPPPPRPAGRSLQRHFCLLRI